MSPDTPTIPGRSLIPGGWRKEDARMLWLALARLPLAHIASVDGVQSIVRRATPPNAAGLAGLGCIEAAEHRLVLYESAFNMTVRALTFDDAVAQLVGQTLAPKWMSTVGLTSTEAFGAAYAQFYLHPKAFEDRSPDEFARFEAQLPAREAIASTLEERRDVTFRADAPPSIPADRPDDAEAEALFNQAIGAWVEAHFSGGDWQVRDAPQPLSHDVSAVPIWRFCRIQKRPTDDDPIPEDWAVAMDGLGLAHGHATRGGFDHFVDDLQDEGPLDGLAAPMMVSAWMALTHGYFPNLMDPTSSTHPKGSVGTGIEADGTVVFVAWFIRGVDRKPARIWLRVRPDGSTEAQIESLESLQL